MSVLEITQEILAAKQEKGLSFAKLGRIVDRDEVWIAALFYRQATASESEATKLIEVLDLDSNIAVELIRYPLKGLGSVVPTDPLIYRFYEIIQVYGIPLKDVIQEKFGDGIMSAIDFTLKVNKEENLNGDRVKVTMDGKFLPYRKW